MKRILIGTTNPAKLGEVRDILGTEFEILSLRNFPNIREVEETGATFAENSILKVKGYFEQTGVPTIADDGGLMIDALNGMPGVYSSRFLGYEATDEQLVAGILERLAGVPHERRTARLGGVISFWDGEHLFTEENYVEGYIADRPLADMISGFPYRSIFVIKEYGRPYSALTSEEHDKIGHRPKSVSALKVRICALQQRGI